MLTRRSAPPVIAAFGAFAMVVAIAMIGTSPSERLADDVEQAQPHGERALTSPTDGVDEERAPELRIRIQAPANLGAGQVRQARVHVERRSLRPGIASENGPGELLEIDFTVLPSAGSEGLVWLSPERLLLPRTAVSRTPVRIGVHSDVPCDAELGDLQVRVRRIAEDAETVVATEGLPPVDCTSPPPSAPKSVHDTNPDCGGSLRVNHQLVEDDGADADAPLDQICVDTPPPRSESEPSRPQRSSDDSQPSSARGSAQPDDEDGGDVGGEDAASGGSTDDASDEGGSDDADNGEDPATDEGEGGDGERPPSREDPAPTDGDSDAEDEHDGGGGDSTDGGDGGGGGGTNETDGGGGDTTDGGGTTGETDGGGGDTTDGGGTTGETDGGGGDTTDGGGTTDESDGGGGDTTDQADSGGAGDGGGGATTDGADSGGAGGAGAA